MKMMGNVFFTLEWGTKHCIYWLHWHSTFCSTKLSQCTVSELAWNKVNKPGHYLMKTKTQEVCTHSKCRAISHQMARPLLVHCSKGKQSSHFSCYQSSFGLNGILFLGIHAFTNTCGDNVKWNIGSDHYTSRYVAEISTANHPQQFIVISYLIHSFLLFFNLW